MTAQTEPLADRLPDRDYPAMAAQPGRVEPAPRRLRGF
jgi:hypothetical protein